LQARETGIHGDMQRGKDCGYKFIRVGRLPAVLIWNAGNDSTKAYHYV